MAFRTNDFKKTTRKAKDGQPAALYPHQLRDKKTRARLDIAIRLFDQMVGKRRGDMDAGVLVDFFGDPRLARGIVACLSQYYQYRARAFAEIVGSDNAARLADNGLASPAHVRARTYAHLNAHAHGFATEQTRAELYAELAAEYNLTAREWDTLLYADSEDNQHLTRPGTVPAADDIAALYNFHALDTALHHAVLVTLTNLTLTPAQAADIRKTAERLGTKAIILGNGTAVTLTPNPVDTHGKPRTAHLARAFLLIAHAHTSREVLGFADIKLGAKPYRLALTTDIFRTLGCPLTQKNCASPARLLSMADTLHHDLLKLRARGLAGQWRIRRFPEPQVSATGVTVPDLALTLNNQTVAVLFTDNALENPCTPYLTVPVTRAAPNAERVLQRAHDTLHSLFTLEIPPQNAIPSDVLALCDRAASQGLVRADDARRALHLLDDAPLVAWLRQSPDPRVRYIPGLGLCAETLVTAIQEG